MKLLVELFFVDTDPDLPPAIRATPDQSGWKFPVNREDDQLFFRTKFSGSLTLTGADFDWLKRHYDTKLCCAEVGVNFLTDCSSGDPDMFWPGYFLLSSVRWDFKECTATIQSVLSRDGYDAFYRVWEKPINVLAESKYSNVPPRQPFVAAYTDFYTWQPDTEGILQHVLPDGNARGVGRNNTEHIYPRGIKLMDMLSKLAIDACSGGRANPMAQTVRSDFYESEVDPVTKRKALQKLVLAGSDAKRPASIKPATVMNLTLKEVLEDLRALHNVYWFIDISNRLRLEHYSWFVNRSYTPTGLIGLNLLAFPEALKAANNEQSDLEGLFGFEELTIQNNAGALFAECKTGNVTYDEACTVRDDKGAITKNPINVGKIWTNLYGGYRNPDTVPDDSVFLCDIVPAGTDSYYQTNLPQLASSNNATDYPGLNMALIGPNGYQQAATLFVDYHLHGRCFSSGLVNKIKQSDGSYLAGQRMAMRSVKPTRYQENITIPLCCEDMPIELSSRMRTNRFKQCGLRQASYDADAETLTLTVEAESRCSSSIVVVTPPDPGSDCPKAGTQLEEREERTYCDQSGQADQQIVATSTIIRTYADGNCGTYELADPIIIYSTC